MHWTPGKHGLLAHVAETGTAGDRTGPVVRRKTALSPAQVLQQHLERTIFSGQHLKYIVLNSMLDDIQ